MSNKVIIITTGCFPEGDAGAVRLLNVARALHAADYKVEVLCRGKLNDSGTVDGIDYLSFRTKSGGRLIKGIDYYLFPKRVKKYLKAAEDLRCIYIYNAHISVFNFCKQFCTRRGIRLVHDCVEWYSPEEFKKGTRSSAYKTKNKINTEIIDSSFSVIAISTFLEDYYKSKGIRTLRVPVLCDSQQRREPKKSLSDEKLVLFFAGAPAKKDYVGNILEAALLLTDEERKRLRIVFIGFDKNYLINKSCVRAETIDSCSEFLELCGRVPRDTVLEKMEEADFVILPRDASLRYAKAGFPSKVTESLANATPIFCNFSSDLDLYLKDGENAVISRSHTPIDLAEALKRALTLSAEEKLRMSENALKTANEFFDYRNYKNSLKEFIG